jgi:hypothetical protein
MQSSRSQRWRERRQVFVNDTTTIRKADYAVDRISCMREAKPFIEAHHYAGTMPASRASFGLFKRGKGGRSLLVGVSTISVPVNNASIPLRTGLEPRHGADLGRFVLLDDVPCCAETFFLSQTIRLLRQQKPEILALVAYSDPVRRIAANGQIILTGHVGQIYGLADSRYVGRSSPRTDFLLPDGTILSPRALSKLRTEDTGAAYAERQIRQATNEARATGETPVQWLERLERTRLLQRRRHPGNHVYVFPLTLAARLASKSKPSLPYPTLDRTLTGPGDVTAMPLFNGQRRT